ncbi:bifunctional phosphoribosyl-AMP cyclohydrolase/phosphoribosyl-ATP diphosphatase HisIE [Sporosarcina sp. Marseille-Q4063]|uniref:bifunctional phosphoribosyl-AMP cyclohydrolase/phosphoribosyl-ATP diphosphatase HisIE n=1 Tax=Sporosarcina sp. Marseille-Q4063 TaxID=2810514 RepID=UPI001BAE971C|nr:bifunctional phosphoribosyl-AMP cyclohydrolase/phosphoribosyl-ATP diphosphatase HisIE [Sporosarcina sp. Marseille-Q4063]QUW22857.1 bifunctional phosphoribosyl-AMP cyclohydrolase/phosphoribosyl-ATP diphosphatase HisIE [Sporosarcina sp. Marseille-Q4063]
MTIEIESISFDEKGLIPAVVQDSRTGKVLMLAYMNEEALTKTIETKETWFFSRSRQELWNKGATSGNRQIVKQLSFDCDSDAVLVQVEPLGPACHTGKKSCFYKTSFEVETSNREIVHEVIAEIKNRRANPIEESYTSYLFREGIDKVLKKVGEESSEVIIGAKNEDKAELTSELADLLYHSLVLMEISDVSLSDIKNELLKRRR